MDIAMETPGLSPAQIDRYRDDGVLVLKDIFGATDTAMWQKSVPPLLAPSPTRPHNGRRDRFVFGVLPSPLYEIHRDPTLVAIARQVLGPDVALYMNRILVKDGWPIT